jgi:glycosyltransferase involved in cell wall biosynthesis
MKHIMREMVLDPLVIPNGIPSSLLKRVDDEACAALKRSVGTPLLLAKVARWDPDKRWNTAVEATARLKDNGIRTLLLARGGIEPHGEEVMGNARSLGLKVKDVNSSRASLEGYFQAIGDANGADILNLRFYCPQDFLRIVYRASDAVLANSGHEPFGLVGLETMAARGVAFTGGTGEDYAIPFHNSIVLETSDPKEIEEYAMYLKERPGEEESIRQAAGYTARQFTWEEVTKNLIRNLEHQARIQGFLAQRMIPEPEPELSEYYGTMSPREPMLAASV